MKIYNRHGDTIIEVMIAIMVLGAALGGAFAVSNRSTLATQANHERYQAQLYANKQAELLRQSYTKYIAEGPKTKAEIRIRRNNFPTAITAGTGCFDNSANWTTTCLVDGLYTIEVTRVPSGSLPITTSLPSGTLDNSLTYNIKIRWDKLGGGAGNLDLVYGI